MGRRKIVYINGDGIGPEVMHATRRVITMATDDRFEWVEAHAGLECYERTGNPLPTQTLALLREHKIGIKGPTTTPGGGGFESVNVRLRKELDLYVGLRPAISIGVPNARTDVNLAVFRENTEGLYACAETINNQGQRVVLMATFNESAMMRLARAAFEYARTHSFTRVTYVDKQNIHKKWGVLYHAAFKRVAAEFPEMKSDHMLVDAMSMRLVSDPSTWGVIVTENMFGDIISDMCAGLVGGLGVVPGANIGKEIVLFEAVHGSAPDIAGRGIANPTALMLSGAMMLEHMGWPSEARRIRWAIGKAIKEGDCTRDLGGSLNTKQFTDKIIDYIF